jgi:hypothetical protein
VSINSQVTHSWSFIGSKRSKLDCPLSLWKLRCVQSLNKNKYSTGVLFLIKWISYKRLHTFKTYVVFPGNVTNGINYTLFSRDGFYIILKLLSNIKKYLFQAYQFSSYLYIITSFLFLEKGKLILVNISALRCCQQNITFVLTGREHLCLSCHVSKYMMFTR